MVRRSTNPFKPTFGSMPFTLAGRTEFIDDVMGGLANQPGDPNRSTIFVGPRGSGKTVLLHALAEFASEQGWVSVNVSAREGMYQEIFDAVRKTGAHLLSERTSSTLTGLQVGPIGIEREVKHHDFQSNRYNLLDVVEDLNAQGVGLLVTIDEVSPSCKELIDFIDTYQHFVADGHDVALLMAGLPSRISALLLDESISFVRRAFRRTLGSISRLEVEEALFDTIMANGKRIDSDALTAAAEATQGFAFAIQLVGYYLWRASYGRTTITLDDAHEAARLAQGELARSVVEPTLLEVSPREMEYLLAMAQDDGPSTTSTVAQRMGISMTNASNLRKRLIERGLIVEARYGVVDFDMPMTREWLRKRDDGLL